MKYSVRFSVDKKLHQIYLYFNYEGGRLKYYTGCRIEPTKWDKAEQRVKKNNVNQLGQTASTINRDLKKIHDAITGLYEKHEVLDQKVSVKELKEELKAELGRPNKINRTDLFSYFEQYITDADVSEGRRKQLKVTRNHFQRFLDYKTVRFDEITGETLAAFERFLKTDEKPKGENTISSNMKRLRAFFSHANKNKWTDTDPFNNFDITQEKYGDPIYLTKAERDLLYNFDLSDKPTLEKVRDIFVFQCLIGARVGDMVKMTWDNIIDGKLTYIQNKTKDEKPTTVTIPLTEKAKSILSQYNLSDGKLLPFITGQRYNVNLKELFEHVGLTRKVVRLNPKTGIQEIVRLCDIASSHMARRTFIGVMYEIGIKNDVIGSMSGHAKGSKAFGRYYAVSEKLKQDAINGID